MRVLVVNTGSSNTKLSLVENGVRMRSHELRSEDEASLGSALADVAEGAIDAVAHRVVHGGTSFAGPVVVDDAVVDELERLSVLAPLHQPRALRGIALLRGAVDAPSIACFDTAFFASLPAAARTYALPREWRERFRLRRFGFHGLSHAYSSRRAVELLGADREGTRVVTCHLGGGSSLAAVSDGVAVDTTMGFTPLEGLVMGTRSGDVDPGLLVWLQTHGGLTVEEISDGLEHGSGMLGLAGTADMRAVTTAAEAGDASARLAIDVYVRRLRSGIAGMAAALNGLDALVFTGGIGEHSAPIRSEAAAGLGFLGVRLDGEANAGAEPDAAIGDPGAPVATFVVAAAEDVEMARQAEELVGGATRSG